MKKKKSQFNLHNDGNMSVILSLKELLNVSSDWMDVKSKPMAGSSSASASASTNTGSGPTASIPIDFQSTQIDKVIDALSLAMPQR